MQSGRERKTKPAREKGGLRQRRRGDDQAEESASGSAGWSSALDPELYGAKERARKGRDRKLKKSGRNQADEKVGSDAHLPAGSYEPVARAELDPSGPNLQKLSEDLFVSWEHLLGLRGSLKSRIDTIAAVHGWQGASANQGLLGGIEPSTLLHSIQEEIDALKPASELIDTASLLLEMQTLREQLVIASEEQNRLAEDLLESQEECCQARHLFAENSMELESLRQQVVAMSRTKTGTGPRGSQDRGGVDSEGSSTEAATLVQEEGNNGPDPLRDFKLVLSRGDVASGRRIVLALEALKVPDESVMGARELACWHENKKTIMNSLKTLSSQIYSATTRILFEIIQNADDCLFVNDSCSEKSGPREIRELYLECSDDALVAFHNEKGFQPKDLYAMCQVGESSKAPGSGKIGRKGIGFKSVFQICDRPVVLSPPFQFCFDTERHGVFGYIVPTWVDNPEDLVPHQHRHHLSRIFTSQALSATGTLLVCPIAPRVRGLDLMRDLSFDGLSLAFLKNLEKISFVSSVSHGSKRDGDPTLSAASPAIATDKRFRECVYCLEHSDEDLGVLQEAADVVLKGISLISHKLSHCSIVQRENTIETRRHYRLHSYTILKYKNVNRSGVERTSGEAGKTKMEDATTTISLAFPVDDKMVPLRSAEGELIFAYLPVIAAGFGFAINADFELVASRQDVSDSHGSNHVLLGRIPSLFVHAILTDPALGEDAFATYLPDVESIRQDRSGGGRKWRTLATALHRETGAWMTIPTEDVPVRAKRKHVVLRPQHLSPTLVSNSLLKQVTSSVNSAESTELNFAHAEAVVDMALEKCINLCPVNVILDCIRAVLDPFEENEEQDSLLNGLAADDDDGKRSNRKQRKGKQNTDKARSRHLSDMPPQPASISEEMMLSIWRYLTAERESCLRQGDAGKQSLRLIVDAVVGGMAPSAYAASLLDSGSAAPKPFRIFPVQGASQLRLHSHDGVPLCTGLSPSLAAQGSSVLRLAQKVVPLIDKDRLQGVAGLDEMMFFLCVREATEKELEQQLRNCFRFGMATTADAQLWWDSFRYAVSRGHQHGLVDFMPGAAISLPLAGTCNVVSSRDAQRLSVGLPCLLGLYRKPKTGGKFLLAVPPSALSWSARVHWELSIVRAFGITYPKSDIDRIVAGSFVTDLFYAVAEARAACKTGALEALSELLDVYKTRLSSLSPRLRAVAQVSHRPAECLLESRTEYESSTAWACSPYFVDEVLTFCDVTLEDDSFHNVRDLLEGSLGMLRLRALDSINHEAHAEIAVAHDDQDDSNLSHISPKRDCNSDYPIQTMDMDQQAILSELKQLLDYPEDEICETEETEEVAPQDEDHIHEKDGDQEACDEAAWEVLQRVLGFHHTFGPEVCPWLLYSVLTPVLLGNEVGTITPHPKADLKIQSFGLAALRQPDADCSKGKADRFQTLRAMAPNMKSFLTELEIGAMTSCSLYQPDCRMDAAADLWPLICHVGAIWLGGDLVTLERCVWKSEDSEVAKALAQYGCATGRVVSIQPMLVKCMDEAHEFHQGIHGESRATFLAAMEKCSLKGAGVCSPALPYPTDLDMMLHSTLPMLLERDVGTLDHLFGVDEHSWSQQVRSCYAALVSTLADGGFPAIQRCMIPVPSANFKVCQLMVDRGLNRRLPRDAAALLVLPDPDQCPAATAFVLRHYAEHCLHPGLVTLFSLVADRQSVGFESACERIQRRWRHSLRLAAEDMTTMASETPATAALAASSTDELDQLWTLVSEVYGRPPASGLFAVESPVTLPPGLSDVDHWELLVFAAITCAKQWFVMQTSTDTRHAACYQETLQRVRRLVPFVTSSRGSEVWEFLSDRRSSGEDGIAPGVLVLSNLHGINLYGNIAGVQMLERAPAYSTLLPSSILLRCNESRRSPSLGSFPEDFERKSLILVWDWFLLEVAGAAPPTVLWSTIREPVARSSRQRIRRAEESLLSEFPDTFHMSLLECIWSHTRIDELMNEMDAVDEARQREREAAAARQRAEMEARRRQRELELQEEERRRQLEREQRRARRAAEAAAQEAMEAARPSPPTPPQQQRQQWPDWAWEEPAEEPIIFETAAVRSAVANDLAITSRVLLGLFGREFNGNGGSGGDGPQPVRRHAADLTIRESEVKGKLARFLAGMRAYQRQQAAVSGDGGSASLQPLPPVLLQFIAWAGDMLGNRHASSGAPNVEEIAHQYVFGNGAGGDAAGAAAASTEPEEDDLCSICLEGLGDASVYEDLGEPLETACHHRFHAVCYAKAMETSANDPWCPICRSDNFRTVRFP
jgi:hypothetical protein